MPQTGSGNGSGAHGRVVAYEYPAGPDAPSTSGWVGWSEGDASNGSPSAQDVGLRAEFDARLNEEARKAFEQGREQGRQEARQAERESHAAEQLKRTRQAAELVESFRQERDRYLQSAEREVVELALAVSARILRREAQMDPLLLTGAVRVALGQISGSTQVRLRVPPEDFSLWAEAMTLLPNLAVKPTVIAAEGMRLGDCRIETEMGTVDLGIRAQLSEIERGFFDRAGVKRAEATARLHQTASDAGVSVGNAEQVTSA